MNAVIFTFGSVWAQREPGESVGGGLVTRSVLRGVGREAEKVWAPAVGWTFHSTARGGHSSPLNMPSLCD